MQCVCNESSAQFEIVKSRGAHIFHKYWSCVRIVGARMVTCSKLHTADPHILGTAIENSVTWDLCTCCAVKSPIYFFVSTIYCLSQYLSLCLITATC